MELDIHRTEQVVVLRRTAEPFARVADIDAATEAVTNAIPVERRKGYALLADMRTSPLRTDPSLEPAFDRYRTEIERGYERVVVVVTTVVGRIRSDRLGQTSRIPVTVVGSIEEAWTVLETK